jgi:hypothetical protein
MEAHSHHRDENSSLLHVMQCEPVIASPAKRAADRAQRKQQAQKAVERARFRLFEIVRIATWAFSPNPKQMRQPIGPIPV